MPMTNDAQDRTGRPAQPVAPVVPTVGAVRPLGIERIRIDDGFWGARQRLNQESIIPHLEYWEERAGWLKNFDAVVDGTVADVRTGQKFADSEIYKTLEAMAWEVARSGDAGLQARFDRIVARVAAAQKPDGYLNTRFGNAGQPPRYSDLEWGHELYCFGHLIQAAVARLRTGHRDLLVEVAIKAADHVCEVFGPDGLQRVCGHPEIETALVELSRVTGDERYLRQARLFLDRRGHGTLGDIEFGRSYFQDEVPIRDNEVLRGHAVRALYLTAGAIDAGIEEHDVRYVDLLRAQYDRTLARRTYITGGMGSHHQDEAFGDDFELPPDRAYCETCAAVASVMVAWRLLLATGDLRYGDVIERTLYNVIAASPSDSGRAFFYTNPLQQRVAAAAAPADELSLRAQSQLRAPWFEVSCCPPNVARTFAQLSTYVATQNATGVQIIQYMTGDIRAELDVGVVELRMTTGYPDDGVVTIDVDSAPDVPWTLTLRIPEWAESAVVTVDDAEVPVVGARCTIPMTGSSHRIVLHLPMEPRIMEPDPRIDSVRGTVAVARGPLVMCLESVDLPVGVDLESVRIDAAGALASTRSGVEASGRLIGYEDATWPYRSVADEASRPAVPESEPIRLPLVPYHTWANRGPSTMRVWIPRSHTGRPAA